MQPFRVRFSLNWGKKTLTHTHTNTHSKTQKEAKNKTHTKTLSHKHFFVWRYKIILARKVFYYLYIFNDYMNLFMKQDNKQTNKQNDTKHM